MSTQWSKWLTSLCLISKNNWKRLVLIAPLFFSNFSYSESLIVLEARASSLKSGQSVEGESVLTLKEGEKVTLIRSDGVSVSLKGPFKGIPIPKSNATNDPREALNALMTARDARTSSVGVIRAGSNAATLPSVWLIDVSRPGGRCVLEGQKPVFWRPSSEKVAKFSIVPSDRSFKFEHEWAVSSDQIQIENFPNFNGQALFRVDLDGQEFAITIYTVPNNLPEVVMVRWMLEKGCIQQVNTLMTQLQLKL